MDTDKEGTLARGAEEAIGDAAKANVNAAVEVAKSALTAFVDTLIGEPQKPKRRSTRKKAAPKHGEQTGQGEAFRRRQEVCVRGRSQGEESLLPSGEAGKVLLPLAVIQKCDHQGNPKVWPNKKNCS